MKAVPLINDVSLYVVNNLSVFTTDDQEVKIENIRLKKVYQKLIQFQTLHSVQNLTQFPLLKRMYTLRFQRQSLTNFCLSLRNNNINKRGSFQELKIS